MKDYLEAIRQIHAKLDEARGLFFNGKADAVHGGTIHRLIREADDIATDVMPSLFDDKFTPMETGHVVLHKGDGHT